MCCFNSLFNVRSLTRLYQSNSGDQRRSLKKQKISPTLKLFFLVGNLAFFSLLNHARAAAAASSYDFPSLPFINVNWVRARMFAS